MIKLGGIAIYPLSLLFITTLALILDKILFYRKSGRLPKKLPDLNELESVLSRLEARNIYRQFFLVILQNKNQPIWWLESRAADEAKLIEKNLAQGLWILETITTAAPLLGLLGTIIGMMSSFKLMGAETLLNPTGITAGVAEALIATAFGLLIAIFSLFAFNYFSRRQDEALDDLERLGTGLIDQIKLH